MQRTSPTAASSKKSTKRKHEEIAADEIEVSAEELSAEEKKPARKKARGKADKDVSGATTQELLAALQPLPPLVAREFNSRDVDLLSQNENFRYLASSKKVGHAVIVKDKDGSDVALQFHIPEGEEKETPDFRPLKNIEEIERFGMTRYRASTPDGTQMFATRFEDGEFDEEKLKIWNFSPMPKNGKEPFWGSEKELPLFNPKVLEDPEVKEELDEIFKKGTQYKGGRELQIESVSVQKRDQVKKRVPDQNTVMDKESARDAYEAFFDTWVDELSPEMKEVFKRAFEAPLKDVFKGQYRPEWLHAEGHGLTPVSIDPQRKDNLGAAGKWVNTEMMVLERIVKWFALNRPDAVEKIKPHFEMLLDSELIKKVNFEVSIEEQGHIVKLLQDINPLKKWPIFRKPSDLAQGTAIVYSLLNGIDPISKEPVKKGGETLRARKKSTEKGKLADAVVAEKPEVKEQEKIPAPVVAPAQAAPAPHAPTSHPVKVDYHNTVLQIYTTSHEPDYDEPWHGAKQHAWHGSGLVVEHDGKKYVLTNAHVAENAINMRVRFAHDRKKKFQAKAKCVSYQSDLALLEIDDPAFQQRAVPAVLGDMVVSEQPVKTVGFPMGGEEVNIAEGIVSRIEVGEYCESGLDMLHVGVSAAINSGNSGGPVFSNGKVVGVAFQGWPLQGLGFMIPMPIVHHFLKEVFSGKPYRGYPILPVELQTLENPALRASYGMKPDQSGVRVKRVDTLCDAHGKLKSDDILLAIDGLVISNEGTVDIPGIGRVIDMLHVTHSKFIGDTVTLTVLRMDPVTEQHVVLDIPVVLDNVPLETTKVPQKEYDKMPTYFVCSGISFEPLTRNYMEERGADFEELVDKETGERITDIPKKTPDEQFVIINDVLDCEATEGYEDYLNSIVKEVNGRAINNIRDVVAAMDGHQGEYHTIITSSRSKIVVKNMSPEENAELFARYEIHADRSKDLRDLKPVAAMQAQRQAVPLTVVPVPQIIRPEPKRATSSTAALLKQVVKKPPVDEDELMSDWDESEDAGPAVKAVTKKSELTADKFTGVKTFRGAVDRIEENARLLEQLGFEDDEFEIDELGEESVESIHSVSEESSESESESEEKPKHRSKSSRHHASMFSPKDGKRKRDEDEEDKSRDTKRFRGEAGRRR